MHIHSWSNHRLISSLRSTTTQYSQLTHNSTFCADGCCDLKKKYPINLKHTKGAQQVQGKQFYANINNRSNTVSIVTHGSVTNQNTERFIDLNRYSWSNHRIIGSLHSNLVRIKRTEDRSIYHCLNTMLLFPGKRRRRNSLRFIRTIVTLFTFPIWFVLSETNIDGTYIDNQALLQLNTIRYD